MPLRVAWPSGGLFPGRYFLDMSQFCSLVMTDTLNPLVSAPGAMFERRDPELLSISCVHCDRTLTVLCSHLFSPETSNLEFKKEKLFLPADRIKMV